MRRLLVASVMLAACGASQTPAGSSSDRGWFCRGLAREGVSTSQCFRTRDDCMNERTPPGWEVQGLCDAEPVAYCVTAESPHSAAIDSCYASETDCEGSMGAPRCAASN
jgi:hypothetical protein